MNTSLTALCLISLVKEYDQGIVFTCLLQEHQDYLFLKEETSKLVIILKKFEWSLYWLKGYYERLNIISHDKSRTQEIENTCRDLKIFRDYIPDRHFRQFENEFIQRYFKSNKIFLFRLCILTNKLIFANTEDEAIKLLIQGDKILFILSLYFSCVLSKEDIIKECPKEQNESEIFNYISTNFEVRKIFVKETLFEISHFENCLPGNKCLFNKTND